jgi:Activator of Hsp90 ATPase homolog 1-like protein
MSCLAQNQSTLRVFISEGITNSADHESAEGSLASLRPGGSLVEIELEEHQGGTLLRLRHSALPEDQAPCFGEHWCGYLGILAGFFVTKEQAAGQKL